MRRVQLQIISLAELPKPLVREACRIDDYLASLLSDENRVHRIIRHFAIVETKQKESGKRSRTTAVSIARVQGLALCLFDYSNKWAVAFPMLTDARRQSGGERASAALRKTVDAIREYCLEDILVPTVVFVFNRDQTPLIAYLSSIGFKELDSLTTLGAEMSTLPTAYAVLGATGG